MSRKKIIVACANGVATSQAIVYKLQSLLEERGIMDVDLLAVDIKSVESYLYDASAYVCLIRPDHDFKVPIVDGIKILTGVGADEELDKLVEILKK